MFKRGRPQKITDEEIIELWLWKRTKGVISEISRITGLSWKQISRRLKPLKDKGLLKEKHEIKPEETASLITAFEQLPEIIGFRQWAYGRGPSPKTIEKTISGVKTVSSFVNETNSS
ncbi:MAG: hypothetical protein QXW43_04935 [Candidatus Methanomethyliaceae archaeon]